jgi:hypothetical protein
MSTLPTHSESSKPLWRTTAPNLHPEQVAQRFADEAYEGRRVVDFEGGWGGDYRGTFRLKDGVRPYTITGNLRGEWEVSL